MRSLSMPYTCVLIVQRLEELKQQLLTTEDMAYRHVIDLEMAQMESALEDFKGES